MITILELAIFRGMKESEDGTYSLDAIEEVGLSGIGGCAVCGACVAAYNACPSKAGYLKCAKGCIGTDGWDTVEAANNALFRKDCENA